MASILIFEAFIAFFSFLIFCYFLTKKPFDYFLFKKKILIGYPWNWPVVGMLPGFLLRIHRIEDSVKILENSNMTFRFQGPWFAGMDVLITIDPANTKHIMNSNISNFIKGPVNKEYFDAFGDGIINSDFERGNNLKKCYQTLFHRQEFQNFSMNTITSKLKNVLIPLFNHYAEEEKIIDLQDVFRRLTFDTTLVTVTGSDPKSLSIDMPNLEFVKAFDDIKESILYRHLKPKFLWKLQKRLKLGQEKKLMEADATIDRLCSQYITAKKSEIQEEMTSDETEDILTFFIKLDAIKYKISKPDDERFLRDVLLISILAGRDTMASALTWFFWNLSQNPKVVTEIRQEINKNLPRTGNCQENLDKLVYLHGALYESMRLYPPSPFQRKTTIKEDVLPSGHKIGANSAVMVFLYAMGRMKSIWGDDAMEYKPERWVLETGRLRHEPSYKFFAFNSGPRICLGKNIAMNQLKIMAVEILQRYDINVVEGHKIEPKPYLVLHMKNGLRVKLTKRCLEVD